MASPTAVHQRYRNKAGIVVPGVTTVINLLAKPALINWAWKLGLAGEDMNKVRDKAADIGTCVHQQCDMYLKKAPVDLTDFTGNTVQKAEPLYKAFVEWFAKEGLVVVASEVGVVSEAWQFGGTIDFVATDPSSKRGLFDIKTSKGIYDEYKIQLAAYEVGWNETHPKEPIDYIKVVHLDKETNDLHLYNFSDLGHYFEIFKHLRAIYILQKKTDPNRDKGKSYRKKVEAANV